MKRIGDSAAGFDRPSLLRLLNLDAHSQFVADVAELHRAEMGGVNPLRVAHIDVPYLDNGTAVDCCSGAKLKRFRRSTVTIPCFSAEVVPHSMFCQHCSELWAQIDDNGWYVADSSMPAVVQEYAVGENKALRNLSGMKEVFVRFSDMIQEIKDALAGSKFELQVSWPDASLEFILQEVLVESGTLFPGSADLGIHSGARWLTNNGLLSWPKNWCACGCGCGQLYHCKSC